MMNNEPLKTILLVEDNIMLSVIQSQIIRNFGYNVINTHSGEKAVEIAVNNTDVSLILMDIDLGEGLDGPGAAEQILELRDIPIVFLTSHSEKEIVEKVRGITRYGYVIKNSGDFVLQSSIEMAFELFAAHEKTKVNEERYRELYNNINAGVAVYEAVAGGRDFIFRDFNRAGEKIDNCRREDLIGRKLTEMRPDVEQFGLLDVLRKVWQTGVPQHLPITFYDDNRIQGWYENFVYRLSTGEVVAVFENITDRKRSEEDLNIALAKYRTLFEVFPLGITISDTKGRIRECNTIAEKLLGLSMEQHVQRNIDGPEWNIIRPDGSPMNPDEYASVKALREKRVVENVEMGIVRPDKTTTWINVTAAPVPLDGYGVVISYADITAHKNSEEEIKFLIREKETLLREANHRLKNNMNIIHSLLLLQADTMTEPSAKNALEDSAMRVQNLQSLYNRLYLAPDFSSMSINDFLPPLVDEIVSNFPEIIDLKIIKNVEDFSLNEKQLQYIGIIINELLTNILKYAFKDRDEGLIEVSSHLAGDMVGVTVRDNGNGLPETVDPGNSKGFGLMLVKSITDYLNGTIRIERNSGTNVILEFRK